MAKPPCWEEAALSTSVQEIRLSAWKWFSDYVNQELLDYTDYIYRGHANSSWNLEPTLDRVVTSPISSKRSKHLEKFKYAVRGRRGANPELIQSENDWWALGQHHGLLTPLLDWTESPFVALFFAFIDASTESGSNCCVWAISQEAIERNNGRALKRRAVISIGEREPIVEIVRPLSDENSRLVNQRGLFTRGPNNIDLETWTEEHSSEDDETWAAIKIVIPRDGAADCIRYLNRMNINHSTLFPDLYGASHFCNMDLRTDNY